MQFETEPPKRPTALATTCALSLAIFISSLLGLLACPAAQAGLDELAGSAIFRCLPLLGFTLAGLVPRRRGLPVLLPERLGLAGKTLQWIMVGLAAGVPLLLALSLIDLLLLIISAAGVSLRITVWLGLILILISMLVWWLVDGRHSTQPQSCCARIGAPLLVWVLLGLALFLLTMVPCASDLYAEPDGEVGGSNFGLNTEPGEAQCSAMPGSVDALEVAVSGAAEPFTVVATRHSWSTAVQGKCLLSLAKFQDITYFPTNETVRVGAGVKFRDLQDALHAANRTLPNYGAVNVQTVIGSLLTATHGTGTTALHNFIAAMHVLWVDDQGTVRRRRLSRDNDTSAVAQWAVSLGALGVVIDVDLVVVPRFNIQRDGSAVGLRWMSFDDAYNGGLARFLDCASCMNAVSIFPLALGLDVVLMQTSQVTTAIATKELNNSKPPPVEIFDSLQPLVSDNHLLVALVAPIFASLGSAAVASGTRGEPADDQMEVVDAQQALGRSEHQRVRHIEMEIYVDLSEGAEAVSVVRDLWEAPELNYIHTYFVYCRVVRQDSPLPGGLAYVGSPFTGRDTMTLSIFYYGERIKSRFRRFAAKLLAEMRRKLQGEIRLHPGKWSPEQRVIGAEARAADKEWDPLMRFGSDYFSG